jgi:ferredoxin
VVDADLEGLDGCGHSASRMLYRGPSRGARGGRVVDVSGDYAHVEVILENSPEELREKAKAAERHCPNRVITIVED